VLCACCTVSLLGISTVWFLSGRRLLLPDDGSFGLGPSVPAGVQCSEEGLRQWVMSGGSRLKPLALDDFLNEQTPWDAPQSATWRRGMMALQSVEQGDVIISVPLNLSMGFAAVNRTSLRVLLDKHPDLDSFSVTVMHILYEAQNPNSFWSQYLCMLPRRLPSPIFWSMDALNSLDERTKERVMFMRTVLLSYWKATVPQLTIKYPSLFPKDKFTASHFVWASGIVLSRSWAFNANSTRGPQHCIVPFLDMVNHDNHAGGVSFAVHPEHATLVASGFVTQGQEVKISYGSKCNTRFLLNYGFTPAFNEQVLCDPNDEGGVA